jgi:hypothetical protein
LVIAPLTSIDFVIEVATETGVLITEIGDGVGEDLDELFAVGDFEVAGTTFDVSLGFGVILGVGDGESVGLGDAV